MASARPHAIQETSHRAQQVVGQISMAHRVAEQCPHSLRAGGRRGRDQQRVLREFFQQRTDEGRGGLHLTHRNRVDP